jgi:TrmH family RNA methyltransferase
MKKITSRDNAQYRRLLALAGSGRSRRELGAILLDGPHLLDAYEAAFGDRSTCLVVRASSLERHQGRAGEGRDCLVLADGLFNALSPVATPAGLLAVVSMPPAAPSTSRGLIAVLDGVQDPGNLGAILRSAAAAGATQALLSADCADPWSPKSLRGGMGAQFVLGVRERCDLTAELQAFAGPVVAADPHATASLFEASLAASVAIVIGGEGQGVSPPVLALSTQRVRIPMTAGIESLNAGVAAALLFYEWRRRHAAAGGR